ncbi:15514_t:CDS:2, partial [Dentiscutata erythropus]
NGAIRKQISCARTKNMPTQPQSLENINVPDQLCITIKGEQFLAKDIEFNNEKIMIFFYVLMTSKTEESYTQLFQELINLGYKAGYELSLPIIITDFEQSVINSIHLNFPNSTNKYSTFSIKLRHLTALAFLPSTEIPAAFDQIKPLMPPNASNIINYFENTYIRREIRQQLRNRNIIYDLPLFLPSLWSHHRWNNIIGKAHVGVYTIIEEMRKEQHQTDINIERVLRREP